MDKIDLDKNLDKLINLVKKRLMEFLKEYKYDHLLLNKKRQIVYFNYFVSVFRVLLSIKW